MCGRFTLHHSLEEVAVRFQAQQIEFDMQPRYNIAPSQPLAIIRQEAATGARLLEGYQWGLVPFWAKDPQIGNRMINARAETLADKPAFKNALKRRRCIIPADGFYEWKTPDAKIAAPKPNGSSGDAGQPLKTRQAKAKAGPRQPTVIGLKDDAIFGFAGLWEEWHAPDGSPLRTCAIITTTPNELMASIHDRMPAMLRPEDEALWLDPTATDAPELLHLLRPYATEPMRAHPVSYLVNSPGSDVPACIESLDITAGRSS